VGAPLYTIDTEAEATVTAASSSSSTKDEVTEEAKTVSTPPIAAAAVDAAKVAPANEESKVSSTIPPQRTPLIRFLGKQGWADLKSGKKPQPGGTTITKVASSPHDTTVISIDTVHPMYGRPHFTVEEMDALIFGGANLVE